MALIRWQPFNEMDRFFDDDFFSDFFSRGIQSGMRSIGFDLAVDVYEDRGNIVAEMNLPGIDPENVHVEVEDNYLRISGSREEKTENKDRNYYSREIKRGSFERTVALPSLVKANKAEARYEDGVLKVVIPKEKEEKKKNRIEIKKKGKK